MTEPLFVRSTGNYFLEFNYNLFFKYIGDIALYGEYFFLGIIRTFHLKPSYPAAAATMSSGIAPK